MDCFDKTVSVVYIKKNEVIKAAITIDNTIEVILNIIENVNINI